MGRSGTRVERRYGGAGQKPPAEQRPEEQNGARLLRRGTVPIPTERTRQLSEERSARLRLANRIAAINGQLAAIASDGVLRPIERAHLAYTRSRTLIEAVFELPTAQCVGETKRAVASLVDMIVADDETARGLLRVCQHDHTTFTHSVNVGMYGTCLARRLYGTHSSHNLRELGAGFFLHDLGKTGISQAILNKPGKLSERELVAIRSHPYRGFALLAEANQASEECRLIALQHHERDGGGGYPQGRSGSEIHHYARICSIADVFDALVSQRPYKDAVSPYRALEIMRDEMLGHFHRELLESFVMMLSPRPGT